jgi:hypothetical protein
LVDDLLNNVTGSGIYVLSGYVRNDGAAANDARIEIYEVEAPGPRIEKNLTWTWGGSGNMVPGSLTGGGNGSTLGTGVEGPFGDDWYRVWIAWFSSSDISGLALEVRIYPDVDGTDNDMQVWHLQVELSKHMTSVIEAIGGAQARTADFGLKYHIDNWTAGVNAEGSMELKLTPLYVDVSPTADTGILTPLGGTVTRGFYADSSAADRLRISDGTTEVTLDDKWSSVGQTVTVKGRWSSSLDELNISVDGVAATAAAYDDSFNQATGIIIGETCVAPMCVRDITIYNEDKGAAWLAT